MIIGITGKIGGGKTYWCVNYIVEKYLTYKPEIFQYVTKTDLKIITNIRDLELPHIDLKTEIDHHGISGVFNPSYVSGHGNTLFIIDEAQNYFHRKYYDKDVFLFFQTSRHYGVDILLITQDMESVSKEVRLLIEYTVHAQSRSQRTKNMFVYKYISGDDVFKRQLLKFNKKVAMLYKSRLKEEMEKAPIVWKRFAFLAILVFAGMVVCLKLLFNIYAPPAEAKQIPKGKQARLLSPGEVENQERTSVQKMTMSKNKVEENQQVKKQLERSLQQKDDEQLESGKVILMENGRVTGYVVHDSGLQGEQSSRDCMLASIVCKGSHTRKVQAYCDKCYLEQESAQAKADPERKAANEQDVNALKENPSPSKKQGGRFNVFDPSKEQGR